MPVITIEGGTLAPEQKRELVTRLTKESAQIMKVPEQAFIVLVKENPAENIGVGGQLLVDR